VRKPTFALVQLEKNQPADMNTWLILVALMLILVLGAAGLRRVPAQRAATVRRFGRYRRTVGPGWHWLWPQVDKAGAQIELINHHLQVQRDGGQAELYYQILDPAKAGETLERMDDFVAAQARESVDARTTTEFKLELNRRVGPLGLRVIRCSLHAG
jgi:regulator of protease activity HflC (stomatin/prohibitin superfamily)